MAIYFSFRCLTRYTVFVLFVWRVFANENAHQTRPPIRRRLPFIRATGAHSQKSSSRGLFILGTCIIIHNFCKRTIYIYIHFVLYFILGFINSEGVGEYAFLYTRRHPITSPFHVFSASGIVNLSLKTTILSNDLFFVLTFRHYPP